MPKEVCFSCSKIVPKEVICYKAVKYPRYKFCKNCWDELEKERAFNFKKDNVPVELKKFLQDIEHNIRKWKSFYMATWGLILHFLNPELINKGKGSEIIPFGLPAAKRKIVLYKPEDLRGYLASQDSEIHSNQLIRIFILFEKYFAKYYELLENKNGLSFFDPSKFWQIKKYLKKKKFASDQELASLKLAKETRNCLIHKGIIDSKWLESYKKNGGRNNFKVGDDVPINFSNLEDYSNILIRVVERSIEKLS